jgi:CheY-like chemotaxis protein
MDAATRARVFEPFFTTKEVGKGTGLGLATVYGIVKQSGGHIGVWSEPGRGTTFTILLPLTQEAAIDVKPPAADLPRGAETVLLVEDDESVRGLSARLLRMAGYTVLEAGHGVEAVELAARYSEHIHLLVTDVVMPRMSGRVLADVLAAQRPGLRVLFVTGYTEEGSLCRDAGGHPVLLLTKPFAPEELARKVREALDEGRGGPRAAHTNGRHG